MARMAADNGRMMMARFVTLAALLVACALLLTPGARASDRRPPDARPNILLILVDDLGYGQLSVTGHPVIKTPNIDRLATEGVQFTHGYAGSTVCSPSRVSLMTGRDLRMIQNLTNGTQLTETDVTFARVLQRSGYQTALFGKYGIGGAFGRNDPMTMGFTAWSGLINNIEAHRQYPTIWYVNNSVRPVAENIGAQKGAYAQRMFTDAALQFLDQRDKAKPFFVMMSYTAPHADLAAPDRFVDPYRGKFAERPYPGWAKGKPGSGFSKFYPDAVDAPHAVLAGMVSALDSYVGELTAALERHGVADNTLIIFTSDNGPHSEGGGDAIGWKAAAPYRGGKRDLYDGGIHVPMIMRWPSRVAAGTKNAAPISFADFLPTFAEAAQAPAEALAGAAYNGKSFFGVLTGARADLDDRTLYWAYASSRPTPGQPDQLRQAARKGKWKAVRLDSRAQVQLFDIIADPGETIDLAARHRKLAQEFQRLFDAENDY